MELEFYVKEKNLDYLTQYVSDISNPSSPNYGKHLTKQQLDDLTVNTEGVEKITEYLNSVGANVTKSTSSRIWATASVSVWNEALFCQFSNFEKAGTREPIIRTTEYSLPPDVAQHVNMIGNTVQFPVEISRGPIRVSPVSMASAHSGAIRGPIVHSEPVAAQGEAETTETNAPPLIFHGAMRGPGHL